MDFSPFRKQDSYTMALEESSDEDYIDKEINRKIALKRTESVKSVVKECINENDDILFRIKRRSKKEQDALNQHQQVHCQDENLTNMTTAASRINAVTAPGQLLADANANSIDQAKNLTAVKIAAPHPLLEDNNRQHQQQQWSTTETEANAAVIIQSMFKGYKTRKELGAVTAFLCHTSEEQLETDDTDAPVIQNQMHDAVDEAKIYSNMGQNKKKRRQDSYLQAVSSPPEEDAPEEEEYFIESNNEPAGSLTRPWKKRQDSYLAAITGTTADEDLLHKPSEGDMTNSWKNRQDSYLIAINATINSSTRTGAPHTVPINNNCIDDNSANTRANGRQHSYEQAIDSAVNVEASAVTAKSCGQLAVQEGEIVKLQQQKQSHHSRRQDSYQQAILTSSAALTDPISKTAATVEEINNLRNLTSFDEAQKQEQPQQIGDKLNKWAGKKQSRSPRRRPEAYQRPCSSSSEEDRNMSTSHPKRSHRHKVTKKSSEKSSDSLDISAARAISKFSEAADVVRAAKRIQSAYRSYKAREEIRLHHDEEMRRKRRKGKTTEKKGRTSTSSKVRHNQQHRAAWADVVNAVVTIQKAYRKYRKEKILRGLGVIDDLDKAEQAII